MRHFRLLALAPLGLSACSHMPLPDILPIAATYESPVSATRHKPASVIGDYTHRDPVEPSPWKKQNDQQSTGSGNS